MPEPTEEIVQTCDLCGAPLTDRTSLDISITRTRYNKHGHAFHTLEEPQEIEGEQYLVIGDCCTMHAHYVWTGAMNALAACRMVYFKDHS